MDRLSINIGNQNNDGLGDKIRDAFIKVNNNFETLFNVNASGASQADVAAVSAALANEISGRHVASAALENHVNAVSAALNAVSVNTVSVANRVSAILNSNTTLGAPTYTFNSGTPSTAKTNGTIVVPGGVGVGGNIVANALYSDNYFFANGNPISTGGGGGGSVISAPIYDLAYYQNGGTAVFGTPNLSYNGNSMTMSSGNAATSTSTGALKITGGAGITGNLYVGGNVNFNGQDLSAAVASINSGISSLSNAVSALSQRISVTNTSIANEISARVAASAALELHINTLSALTPDSSAINAALSVMSNKISTISVQVLSVDIALSTRINTVSNALSVETADRLSAAASLSATLQSAINTVSAAVATNSAQMTSANNAISNAVSIVSVAAANATSIANAASIVAANATSIANAASNAVSVEIANRQSASAALETHINTVSNAVSVVSVAAANATSIANAASNAVSVEIANRQSASAALQNAINTVSNAVSVVSAAHLSSWNAISNEISARGAASAALEAHINSVSATAGNLSGNVTVGGALTVNSGNSLGNVTAILNGGTTGVGNIGSSIKTFNTVFAVATTAQYADLAERYLADQSYDVGTVLDFGGEYEVTLSKQHSSKRVAGVVSDKPGFLMNQGLTGQHVATIALMGRIPCKVKGPIQKGDLLVSDGTGYAVAKNDAGSGMIIGKSLEVFYGETGTIEVVVGVR